MTRLLVLTLVAALVAGCSHGGPADLPLPAGTAAGDDPYRVTVVFDDATSLAPKGSCRANDVPVGHVESVELGKDLKPRIVCLVNAAVTLPANATAQLSETGLLGERYVALGPPTGEKPRGRLPAGAVLRADGNQVDPNIEQVLGALSTVLNGGSLERVQTIARELNTALDGREGTTRAVLRRFGTLARDLNAHRGDITKALDSLDTLSSKIAKQRKAIGSAVEEIPAGLAVLNRQRPRLTTLLARLSHLSRVATPLIKRSKADVVADLHLLRPILRDLTKSGDDLTEALGLLLSYPFGSNSLAANRGDYFGLDATMNLSLDTINELLGDQAAATATQGQTDAAPPGLPLSELPDLPLQPPALDLGGLLSGGGR
jgi:phospholipid/cholesterol/gamma-HCH transport system substrate-binding protein